MTTDPTIPYGDAADRLGMDELTMRSVIEAGDLPRVAVGNRVHVPVSAVDGWQRATATLGIPPCPEWVNLEAAFEPEYLEDIKLTIVEVLDTYRNVGGRFRVLAAKVAEIENGFSDVCRARGLSDDAFELLTEVAGVAALGDARALLSGLSPVGEELAEVAIKEARQRFGVTGYPVSRSPRPRRPLPSGGTAAHRTSAGRWMTHFLLVGATQFSKGQINRAGEMLAGVRAASAEELAVARDCAQQFRSLHS